MIGSHLLGPVARMKLAEQSGDQPDCLPPAVLEARPGFFFHDRIVYTKPIGVKLLHKRISDIQYRAWDDRRETPKPEPADISSCG